MKNKAWLLYFFKYIFNFRKFDTKPDSELFVVDTQGDDDDKAKDIKSETSEKVVKPTSAKERKRQQLSKTPKCYEILIPASKVNV